jgi:hypothetical protein
VVSAAEAALFQGTATWGTGIQIDATATGGRNFQIQSSADAAGEGGGKFLIVDRDATGAPTRLSINSGGNVGIGTTLPVSTWLNSFDPTTGNGTFKLTSEGWIVTPYLTGLAAYYPGQGARPIFWSDVNGTNIQSWDNDAADAISLRSSNGSIRLIVKEGGNVGINSTNPQAKLQIDGPGLGEFAGPNSSNAGASHIILSDVGSGNRDLMSGPSIVFKTPVSADGTSLWATSRLLGSPSAAGSARGTFSIQVRDNYDPFNDGTSWNWRTCLTAQNNGNIGIGRNDPFYTLDIRSTNQYALRLNTPDANGCFLNIQTNGTTIGYLGTSYHLVSGTQSVNDLTLRANNNLQFTTGGGTERMRLTSAGALLVNRTSSLLGVHTIQADISGGGSSVLTVYNQNLSDNSPAINAVKNSATTSSTARFIQFYADGGTVPMGGIVGNGASNVQFAAISDIREKENIKTIESSLDKIDKLNPVEFDWKKSGEHIDAGFIAQEVENIFPEYVVENISNEGEEERKGLTGGMTSGIVAHLVKAIQELKADNDSLKARIETLENN